MLKKTSILYSKVQIPKPASKCVIRTRLFDRLNNGLEKAMTLISAPSGYGKTTLISNWLNDATPTATWLSLEESENDLIQFLEYFIAALQQIEPDFAQSIKTEIQNPLSSNSHSVINELINALNDFPQNIALVLDNYHLIQSRDVHDFLIYLIDHIPLQVHLYLISRVDPMFQLSKLRAKRQLIEIRTQDLMFCGDEISQLFVKNLGIKLSEHHVDALIHRIEGWVAGLQMAGLSMKQYKTPDDFINMLNGSHRYIFDYLSEEVFFDQPDHIQEFLLKTSVLRRLSVSLCKELTGRDDAYEILKYLEDSNLFIFILDHERKWYRYHRLFADLLLHRLKMVNPQEIIDLNLKAVRWYLDREMPEEALHYAFSAEDHNLVLDILEESALDMLSAGKLTTVYYWFNQISESLIISSPGAAIYKTWALLCVDSFQPDRYEFYLKNAEHKIMEVLNEGLNDENEPIYRKHKNLLGQLYMVRGWIENFSGNYESGSQLAKKSLDYLSDDDFFNRTIAMTFIAIYSFIIGRSDEGFEQYSMALDYARQLDSQYLEYYMLFGLVKGNYEVGNIKKAEHILDEAEKRYFKKYPDKSNPRPEYGVLLILRSDLLYVRNQLDEAEDLLIKAINISKNSIITVFLWMAYVNLAHVMLAKGDKEKFRDLMAQSEKYFPKVHMERPLISNLMLSNTLTDTFQKYLNKLQHKYTKTSSGLFKSYNIHMAYEQILLAGRFIAEKNSMKAIHILEKLQSVLKGTHNKILYIKSLILTAIAYQQKGDKKIAMEILIQAIDLAEPIGCVRIFLDEGKPLVQLLTLLNKDKGKRFRSSSSDFMNELISYQSKYENFNKSAGSAVDDQKDWSYRLDPMSNRELEVLQCISQGLTNKEIAEILFISHHTVNNHSKNIYSKLNVNNRFKAVEKARKMDLI